MNLTRRNATLGGLVSAAAAAPPLRTGRTQGVATLKIGCLTDMSGPYKDLAGPGAVAAAHQAVQEFGTKGFNVEVLVADHLNKPDVGATIARQWFDRDGVDVIVEVANSGVLQAQTTGAKVRGIANAGADTINTIKQAKEFGIKMRLAGLLIFLTDVHSLSLDIAQGIALTDAFYWDMNDRARAFSDRFTANMPGIRPTMVHAGVYSSSLHYLKTATLMGVEQAKLDGAATIARMKAMPTDDDCFGIGSIRLDGRCIHPSYLWEVKPPSESKGPWDYYKPVASTPADKAFRPLDKGGCSLVKA